MAASPHKDVLFLIRQFFDEEKLLNTAHMLEQEAGFYFDMSYFEGLVLSGQWKKAEGYLSGFCSDHGNKYSAKIYFELRKQEYFEAPNEHDAARTLDYLMKVLQVFDPSNPALSQKMTALPSGKEGFRRHPLLSSFEDVISARNRLMEEIRPVIEANPQFNGKLKLPQFEKSRLQDLINQRCLGLSNIQNPPGSKSNVPGGFPNTVERSMEMNSSPTSMEFHPAKHTFLLVGNRNGEIELWDISSKVKMFWNAFTIWRGEALPTLFLKDFDKDPSILVTRVLWSPDGSVFGVAFSKNIVQLYSYDATTNYTGKRLEIDAHLGSVNDLAFSAPADQLLVITCGDDKFIQVWDVMTGLKLFTYEGHSAPVYSLCTHCKNDIHFLFSTSTNGEIKAWLFDNSGPKVQFDAPGRCCVRMTYSDDCKRLFSCGTNIEGESYILQWNDNEGHIIRTYTGLSKSSVGVVQFCTNSRFLAAGDEHLVKIWDMDKDELLAVIDADGGLPARPKLSFNRKGNILAVFADDNKIKFLANEVGINAIPAARVRVEHEKNVMEASMKHQVPFELNKTLDTQICSKIAEVSSCQCLMLPSDLKTNKISRLMYTYSGKGILALGEDGIHLLWRWLGNNSSVYRMATTNYAPQQWQPTNGLRMINDVRGDGFKAVSPCLALSKNDSVVVSSSGMTISLFHTRTFEKFRISVPSPPTATCLGFYPPDNKIIAIGLDDSTILIYNIRLREVKSRLRGHVRRISGFAFSNTLKLLVSSGVDTQIIVWDYSRWEQKNSTVLQISSGWIPSETSETYVQFYQDQIHFLAVHETQLAVYEAGKLDRVKQWIVGYSRPRILHATLSCDNKFVYAVMGNRIVLILGGSDLSPRFEINPSVYIPTLISSPVHPLVICAHPKQPNQIALGLSNGEVVILEPGGRGGTWVVQPPANSGTLAIRSTN